MLLPSRHTVQLVLLSVILFFLVAPRRCKSWDFAVATESGLHLISIDGQLEREIQMENGTIVNLYALAYDPSAERFFFSVKEGNFSLYEYHVKTALTRPILPKLWDEDIQGIALDVSSQMLYLADGIRGTIRSLSLKDDQPAPKVLLRLPGHVIQGVAVSHCHRAIFWTNTGNFSAASLNRAELDGTGVTTLVSENMYHPYGVTVDEVNGKVYWTGDNDGIWYRIERCSLDGTDRELILRRTHQTPFSVIFYSSTLIWSDYHSNKIWSLSADMTFPNHTNAQLEPSLMYHFQQLTPYGVAGFRNVSISCEPPPEVYTHSSNRRDEVSNDTAPEYCLNNGHLRYSSCQCKRGFKGKYCEINVCLQFCLHGGSCYLNHLNFTECNCLPGYEGLRCERDVCDEYCLDGGRCYIEDGKPTCACPEHNTGQRCEVSATALTAPPLAANDLPVVAGLAAVCCALLVIVMFLGWRVIVLNRRPRVKKRYIVNKTYRAQSNGTGVGQTPMTSRPPNSPAVEQCEITIENCCNMNVCETPCFEPNLRSSKSNSKKSEDRRNLLNNMEEPAGSD